MGRLEDIAARNQGSSRGSLKKNFSFGLRSLFLLVILGLLIFTKWAMPPKDTRPGVNVVPGPQDMPRPRGGIYLMKQPASGSAAGSSAAAGGTRPAR